MFAISLTAIESGKLMTREFQIACVYKDIRPGPKQVSENIEYGRIPNMPLFTTIADNKTMSEIAKVCRNLLIVVI